MIFQPLDSLLIHAMIQVLAYEKKLYFCFFNFLLDFFVSVKNNSYLFNFLSLSFSLYLAVLRIKFEFCKKILFLCRKSIILLGRS